MVATFGNYLWFFFLPLYYESRFGASPLQLSVVYGAWLLAVGVGIAPAGALADIIGRKPVIVTSGLITSSAAFILAFSNNFVLAAFALPLTGFGSSFLQMSYVMVGESVESGRRGVAYGTYQTFANIMAAFSPLAGGLTIFRSASYFQVFVIGGSLTLVATVLRALFLRETLQAESRTSAKKPSYLKKLGQIAHSRVLLALLIVYSMYNLLVDQNSFVLPLYTSQVLGFDLVGLGVIFSALLGVSAVARIPFGKLSDRIGRKKTIMISWIGESLVVYVIVFAPRGELSVALIGIVLWMLFGVMDAPAINAWLADATDSKSRGLSMGVFYSATTLVAAPGAALAGVLFYIQPQFPFYVNSALGVIALVLLISLTRSRDEGDSGGLQAKSDSP